MSSSVRAMRGGEQGGLDGSLHDARACLTEARDAVDRALAEPSTSTASVLDALAAARGAATSLRAAARRQHDLDARRGAA